MLNAINEEENERVKDLNKIILQQKKTIDELNKMNQDLTNNVIFYFFFKSFLKLNRSKNIIQILIKKFKIIKIKLKKLIKIIKIKLRI